MGISAIIDMPARALARILGQYKLATARFGSLVSELAGQVQAAESAVFGVLAQLDLTTASGVWLENLGAIVDEARESLGDTDYRNFIKARVLANVSQGTCEELLTIARTVFVTGGATFALTELPPAAMQLVLGGATMTDAFALRTARALSRARAGGVRLSVLYQTLPDANTFTFSSNATLQASSTQGFGDATNPATGGGFAGAINA